MHRLPAEGVVGVAKRPKPCPLRPALERGDDAAWEQAVECGCVLWQWPLELWPYLDCIREDAELVCFGFDPHTLAEEDGGGAFYGEPVFHHAVKALQAIGQAKNKTIRERAFTLYFGDYGPYFCVGVPTPLSGAVRSVLREQFERLQAFQWVESGSNATLCLVPLLRYDHGAIIDYSENAPPGTWRIDDDDEGWGTGAKLYSRVAAAVSFCPWHWYGAIDPGDYLKWPMGE